MSKRTSMRLPDDLYQWLVERAQRERRTVSNLVVTLLSEARGELEVVRSSVRSQRLRTAEEEQKGRDTAEK